MDTNYLGVDIGGSSIKMVELTNNNGRAQLVTYGFLERSLKGGSAKLIDDTDKTAELIKQVLKKSKVLTKRAVTALPAPAVFSSIISLSEISKKDLSSPKKVTAAVEWEAK
ncbi:pilus assembly protein PilM, partial [Candidatus Falkowbacteria bacterium]|nr:pilus assembly protein PilM [Candidatus Falkowbacteria bacterium]